MPKIVTSSDSVTGICRTRSRYQMRFKVPNSTVRESNTNLVISRALASDGNGSFDGFKVKPNKIFMDEAIGAEYGEGFETFRPDGPLKIEVEFLNERLQAGFFKRIRYAMKCDEAYGERASRSG